jgi:hypothetical protein
MTAADFKSEDRVLYIPGVAHGDARHPDCERGVVSSTNDTIVFVRYYCNGLLMHTPQATSPEDLVML